MLNFIKLTLLNTSPNRYDHLHLKKCYMKIGACSHWVDITQRFSGTHTNVPQSLILRVKYPLGALKKVLNKY